MQCNWRLPDEERNGRIVSWWNCRRELGHAGDHEPHAKCKPDANGKWQLGPEIPEVSR